MTVKMRSSKCMSIVVLTLIVALLTGCGRAGAEKEPAEAPTVTDRAEESAEEGVADLPEQAQTEEDHESDETGLQAEEHAALERFGAYLEYLLKEGDWEELEQYVISRTLTWDEAAEMADLSPAFAHFSGFRELRFNAAGAILAEADLNGDGLKDLIEYLPDVGDNGNHAAYPHQYSLTIYKNRGEQGYDVMYFQPYFDTAMGCFDDLSVLQYEGGIYCMFEKGNSLFAEKTFITVYEIRDGTLTGRMGIEGKYTDVDCEVLLCKSGMEEWAEAFCENGIDYCPNTYQWEETREELFVGSAEERLEQGTEEYALLERIGEEEGEEYRNRYVDRYREATGSGQLCFVSATNFLNGSIACRSDLDNDGEMELYVQHVGLLGLHTSRSCQIYPTGELYGNGRYEGKEGILYSLGKAGERTDFERLCGLDIWSSDWIPQVFWVEQCGEENITFFQYYDRNHFTSLVEAYCIREGNYETVLSIRFRPVLSNAPVYEWHEESENENAPTYTIHLPKGKDIRYPYPVLYGLQDMEVQTQINDTLKVLLQEKIDAFLVWEEGQERRVWEGAWCNVLYADRGKLVLCYAIIFEYEGWERAFGEDVCLEIDLINGEVLLLDYRESEYGECDPWTSEEGPTYRVTPTW